MLDTASQIDAPGLSGTTFDGIEIFHNAVGLSLNQIKSNHLFESGDMAHTQALTHTHTIHNNTKEGR